MENGTEGDSNWMYPKLFEAFPRVQSVTDGECVYDFVGSAIQARFKQNWERNVSEAGSMVKPGYPKLSEWTVDWIACLLAASMAGRNFRVIELGAGYGQWMVNAILAYRLIKEGRCHGLALEAESNHYQWLKSHVERNLSHLDGVETDLLKGAAGQDGEVSFPIIEDPRADYGASYFAGAPNEKTGYETVPGWSLKSIYGRVGHESVDLLHVDIQGGERDLFARSDLAELLSRTHVVLVGTHRSEEVHEMVLDRLTEAGMVVKVNWPRHSRIGTAYGTVNTYDGEILAVNARRSAEADELMRFDELNGNSQ